MKKKLLSLSLTLIALLLSACDNAGEKKDEKQSLDGVTCYVDLVGNSEKFEDQSLSVEYGKAIGSLPIPEREHATFSGWFTNYHGAEKQVHTGKRYNPGYENLTTDYYEIKNRIVTIYANWEVEDITVSLIGNSPSFKDQEIVVKYGDTLPNLPIPTKEKYVFSNWYTYVNEEKVVIWNLDHFVTGKNKLTTDNFEISGNTVNLYADYVLETKDVTLMLDSTGLSRVIKVPLGEYIDNYVKDIRIDGKMVTKWSTIANDTTLEHVFHGPITQDVTLYPAENIYYAINLQAGDVISQLKGLEGEEVLLPNPALQEGYAFVGWFNSNNEKFIGSVVVNQELSLVAKIVFIGEKQFTVRSGSFSENIYTPSGVNGEPTKRDWEDKVYYNEYYNKADLIAAGYTRFNISYRCNIKVIDDGYQWVYIYSGASGNMLYEHQDSFDEGSFTISFSTSINLNSIGNDYFSIRYAAAGFFMFGSKGNEWNCWNVQVTLKPVA